MPSKRTAENRKKAAKKKASKRAAMYAPGTESRYAKKQRGIYSATSPYRPGGPWEAYG